jgi:outer membrane protein OmpA-like peptidoglycan-associated protein
VIVEGYTDSTGSDRTTRACPSVVRPPCSALAQQGVDISRIVTQGYGKEYPVADNGSVSGRAMNRRVEVTISNDNQPVKPRSSMAN